jgi:hypothetical protein
LNIKNRFLRTYLMIIINGNSNYRRQKNYLNMNSGKCLKNNFQGKLPSAITNHTTQTNFNLDMQANFIPVVQVKTNSEPIPNQFRTNSEPIPIDYDTIDGYNSCSEDAKNILRNRFIKECKLKYPGYPFLEENNLDELVSLSKFFSYRHSDNRLVGIGRSPLWVLETGKLIKNGIDDYINAAFSGAFYPECMPDKTVIDHYRNYLKKIELDPETIVNKLKEKGQKTIFIDLVGTGDRMNSFTQIFSDWAKEIDNNLKGFFNDFKESIAINAIMRKGCEGYWNKEFKSGRIRINPDIYAALITQDENLDNKLGIHYSWPEWLRIDPLKAKPSENARLMKFWIMDYLAKRNLLRSL